MSMTHGEGCAMRVVAQTEFLKIKVEPALGQSPRECTTTGSTCFIIGFPGKRATLATSGIAVTCTVRDRASKEQRSRQSVRKNPLPAGECSLHIFIFPRQGMSWNMPRSHSLTWADRALLPRPFRSPLRARPKSRPLPRSEPAPASLLRWKCRPTRRQCESEDTLGAPVATLQRRASCSVFPEGERPGKCLHQCPGGAATCSV
ncbi:hypothetical protein NDU88_005530 [Pleurodeles waltl]|uniref:Uncharacterized protein n=1 Tax=Pleurodeles waltl TaxID=8319 RepID=A0AAV7QL87_PLEWA|nr:hypothetical protein NDU88_005530 [Pleurodeles waltl]